MRAPSSKLPPLTHLKVELIIRFSPMGTGLCVSYTSQRWPSVTEKYLVPSIKQYWMPLTHDGIRPAVFPVSWPRPSLQGGYLSVRHNRPTRLLGLILRYHQGRVLGVPPQFSQQRINQRIAGERLALPELVAVRRRCASLSVSTSSNRLSSIIFGMFSC